MVSRKKFQVLISSLKMTSLAALMLLVPGSNVSADPLLRSGNSAFGCSDIVGRVFDDQNGDGYHNKGEPGLAGVRLATVRGELITTDRSGRFHYPCGRAIKRGIGSNFILKLDTRTLPTGYRVTSENPRVARLTRGKLQKMNFGASRSRVVSVNLNTKAFKTGSISYTNALNKAFGKLVNELSVKRSVLKITYRASANDTKISRKRMREVSRTIRKLWRNAGSPYTLKIEKEIIGA